MLIPPLRGAQGQRFLGTRGRTVSVETLVVERLLLPRCRRAHEVREITLHLPPNLEIAVHHMAPSVAAVGHACAQRLIGAPYGFVERGAGAVEHALPTPIEPRCHAIATAWRRDNANPTLTRFLDIARSVAASVPRTRAAG